MIGAHSLTVERTVPASVAVAEKRLFDFFGSQLFRLARRERSRTTWRSDASLLAHARRTFDLAGRYELPRDTVLEAYVVPEGDEATRVRLVLRLDGPQKKRARSLLGWLALGGAIAAGGTALAHGLAADAILVAAGSGTALAGWGGIRGQHRHSLEKGAAALERFLDHL